MVPKAELSEFRSARERTRSLVTGLSEDEMAEQPAPERWSPGELVDHLLRSERLWRGEIEELVRLVRAGRQAHLSRPLTDFPWPLVGVVPAPLLGLISVPLTLFSTFLPTRLVIGIVGQRTLKARAPEIITPSRGRPAEELKSELESESAATAALFEDNDDLRFDRMVYHNPLIGVVDAVDLLRIVTAHEKRHHGQLIEILEEIGVRGKA